MSFFKREKSTITCPRCGFKCLVGMEECPDCGLVFSRMQVATNKDAKRKILRHDNDFIIYTSKLPSDVKYRTLLLYVIFLGLAGGHCFYVGRYWRGGLLLLNTLVVIICTIFNAPIVALDHGRVIAAIATVCGFIMFIWVYDLFAILLKKFKVPVAIDIDGDIIEQKNIKPNDEELDQQNKDEVDT